MTPTHSDRAVHGETTPARDSAPAQDRAAEPRLPHEHDESSHSQAQATPEQEAVGKQAFRNATDGTMDTDRGPVVDQVYNDKLAPDRGAKKPRR